MSDYAMGPVGRVHKDLFKCSNRLATHSFKRGEERENHKDILSKITYLFNNHRSGFREFKSSRRDRIGRAKALKNIEEHKNVMG